MTVSSTTDRATFPGNGVAQIFPLPFRFFENSDIQVWLVTNATGALTPQTLGVHYTLAGANDPEVDGSSTSALTMLAAPTALQSLFVQRVIPVTQPTDIINQGRFFPEIHETVFDRLTMLIQQGIGSLGKALRVRPSEPAPGFLPPIAERSEKLLSFDQNGDPIAVVTSGDASALALDLLNVTSPVSGAAMVGRSVLTVESLAELQATPVSLNHGVELIDGGRSGLFYFSSADLSAEVAADPLQGIYVAPAGDLTGASGAWVRQFGQAVDLQPEVRAEWWGAVGDYVDWSNKGTDNWAAFQAAANTGRTVRFGYGKFRIHEKAILLPAIGQKLIGAGSGGVAFNQATSYQQAQPVCALVPTGTGVRFVCTRVKHRASAADPQDAPLSMLVYCANHDQEVAHFTILKDINWADTSPTNFGADWDIAVFNGNWRGQDYHSLAILGYFNTAGIYHDVTNLVGGGPTVSPVHGEIPASGNSNIDQSRMSDLLMVGPRQDIKVRGPDMAPAATAYDVPYYNEYTGITHTDGRGGAGAADLTIERVALAPTSHFSGQRRYDNVQPLVIQNEDPDLIECTIMLNARGAGGGGRKARKLAIRDGRSHSHGAAGVVVWKYNEVLMDNLHFEQGSFPVPVRDTAGNVIDYEDTDTTTGHSYGGLAITPDTVSSGSSDSSLGRHNSATGRLVRAHFMANATRFVYWNNALDEENIFPRLVTPRIDVADIRGTAVRLFQSSLSGGGPNLAGTTNERIIIQSLADLRLGSHGGTETLRLALSNILFNLNLIPGADNVYAFGSASARPTQIFAASGTINTSDEREKEQVRELADAERAAAIELKQAIRSFKWTDSVERKGDAARRHFGVMAQEVVRIFERHGLDATEYGMLCYDEWGETPEKIHEWENEYDEDGNLLREAGSEIIQQYQAAGNRYGVRYDQLLAFIVAAL